MLVHEGDERGVFFSILPVAGRDRRLALIVVILSALVFAAVAPFAQLQLPAIPVFVASYQSALAINDLITAVLLLAQFGMVRSRALLLLAGGYLFTAAIAIVHALTFPNLFAPTGVFGAGPQTTVWLYVLWHGGFPTLVLGYALLKGREGATRIRGSARRAILVTVIAVGAAVVALTLIVSHGAEFLPILLRGGRHTPLMTGVVSLVLSLNFAALAVLWLRRPHSALDVWLMVVMCAWLFDTALSVLVNGGRFDLGFYVGRIYGLLAASFVLTMLLIESAAQQTQLSRLLKTVRQQGASERDKTAIALRQQAEERQRIFETSQDLILVTDPQGSLVQVSPSSDSILGYRPEAMIGHSAVEFIHPDDLESTRDEMRSARRGQGMRNFVTRYVHRDGRVVSLTWMGTWSEPVRRYFFIGRDMTEIELAQQALLDSERMARGIIETALDAFVQMDDAGIILDWNSQAEKIFGWSRAEAIGRILVELIVPEPLRARRREGLTDFVRTGERPVLGSRFEIEAQRRDGKEIKVELSITALRRRGGHVFNGFIRDLTDKIAAETQIRQAQKMEAIGQLTGGVAHDFNNILTVIVGTIEILAEGVSDRPDLAAIAKMIDEAAERGADLTKHLLAFARMQPLQPREIDVNTLVVTAGKLLRPTLGEHIEIEMVLATDPWLAFADPSQLTTAVLNLVLNARDAMPRGGKLIIETLNSHLDEGYADHNSEVKPGPYVMIAISDTGIGIAPDLLDKVFEPFFTTKELGRGTGLGLSMVYGFIKQSGGHIKVYSEQGHGTTIKLYLPRSAESSRNPVEALAAETAAGGTELILVVEDDALVRDYVVTQVRSLGYRTQSAANAEEALRAISADPAIDLLFTDVIMPGSMNGRMLAEAASTFRSGLKVLFTSGYTENAIVHHGRLDPGVLLLAKPYRKADLARMIRMALGANRGSE